jgi:hypothetical protein
VGHPMISLSLRVAACVTSLAALAACGGAPTNGPSPRPSASATPLVLDPCSLISVSELAQATGTTYGSGQRSVFHPPPTGPLSVGAVGPGCGFNPVQPLPSPTPGADGLTPLPDTEVSITVISAYAFTHAATVFGRPVIALHPISLVGADAAAELLGPHLGRVFAHRGTVYFSVDVTRGLGEDTSAEERIATIVLSHLP